MITKLWKAFKAWHNKAPAAIEFVVSAKVKQIRIDQEPLVALGAKNLEAEKAKKPKPRIYWKYYPKSKRGYWLVSVMPKGSWHDSETAARWKTAHEKAHELNSRVKKRV